jgi:hypothetical protein
MRDSTQNDHSRLDLDPDSNRSLRNCCALMRPMSIVTGDTTDIARRVLAEALSDPELRELIDQMVADPEVTRRQLYHTAFVQGVVHALECVSQGRILNLGDWN